MGKKLCTHCMSGYIVNGICSSCGRNIADVKERRVDALPLEYRLHNRYILGDVLGWGGFGITYVAWDLQQQCPVAVKELYPKSFVSRGNNFKVCPREDAAPVMEKMKDSFSREALTMIELQDLPGIIKIFHVFDDNNTIYFSMELLKGEDFRCYLKNHGRKMQWSQLSELMRPVINSLVSLHQKGLMHRDISPDNIFICSDGRARLIDFGLARKFNGDTSYTVALKACFAPWEQYDSHGRQGPWTDVYAMAVTLYVALSDVLPPAAPDRVTNTKKTAPMSAVCPGLPKTVARAIDKAMSVKIEQRYNNMAAFYEALYGEPAKQSAVSPPTVSPPTVSPPTPPRRPAPQAMLVCVQGVLQGSAWPIYPDSPLRIGRSGGVEIALPDRTPGVSRLQCTLQLDRKGKFLIRDEGSSFGTIVNDNRLQPKVWYSMKRMSWIRIGQQIFQIQ